MLYFLVSSPVSVEDERLHAGKFIDRAKVSRTSEKFAVSLLLCHSSLVEEAYLLPDAHCVKMAMLNATSVLSH